MFHLIQEIQDTYMIYDTPAKKLGCVHVFINVKLVNSQLKNEIEVLLEPT